MNRFLLTVAAALLLVGCGNKTEKGGDSDSLAVATSTEAAVEKTPMPMFLYYYKPSAMQVVYWTETKEPVKDDDNAEYFDSWHETWAQQEMLRRNAKDYTKMLLGENDLVDIKALDEVLTDPDGETMYSGELHSRASIPSPGMRFALVNESDAPEREWDFGEMFVILHKDYLNTRKMLDVVYVEGEKPLPQDVVKKMEQRYGMKATRSMICCKIGGKYTFGGLQFSGEYKGAKKTKDDDSKKALALELLIDGDSIMVLEKIGYYDENYGPTWNADDGGEYFVSGIPAAFEGPDGLELCYEHGAPESITVGMLTVADGKLIENEYACYHSLVDEQTPLWKKDVATMQKLYLEDDSDDDKVDLTRYYHIDIDDDGIEEVWLRGKDDEHGAFFTCNEGEIELIGVESSRKTPTFYQGSNKHSYLKLSGPAGGPSWYTEIYELKNSKVIHRVTILEVYGEIDEAGMDNHNFSKEDCEKYMKAMPQTRDPYIYWQDLPTTNNKQ